MIYDQMRMLLLAMLITALAWTTAYVARVNGWFSTAWARVRPRRQYAHLYDGDAPLPALAGGAETPGEKQKRLTQEKADLLAEHGELVNAEGDFSDENRARMDEIEARLPVIDGDLTRLDAEIEFQRTNDDPAAIPPEINEGTLNQPQPKADGGPFRELGEQLQAVARAEISGGRDLDPRLLEVQAAASGAAESVPSDGGFLIQTEFSRALLDAAVQEAVLAPMCTPLTIGANANAIELPFVDETSRSTGSRFGGVQVFRRKEAATVTAKKPKFGKHRVEAEEIMGLAYATEELLTDATGLASIFGIAFTSEFSFKLDDEIFQGTGVGECLGLIHASNTALVTQAKETGQLANTIVTENLSKMWTRMPARSKPRSVWLINGEITPELDKLVIDAGTGGLNPRIVTYNEAGAVRIKGRPIVEIEQAAALGTAGDIVLVDMSQYLLIRKGGLQADQSMHVKFETNERTFRWIQRVNGLPSWRSAVTAYKGTASKSPYVNLATRA